MRYKVNIPSGSSGNFKIEDILTDFWVGSSEPMDTYTVLFFDQNGDGSFHPIMQDTTKEFRECQNFVTAATGDVLVAGLGLGCINQVLIDNPNVSSITIVEKYQEVIDLVWSHCPKNEKMTLIKDDIYTWTPNKQFDVAWFDSWVGEDNIIGSNYCCFSPPYEQRMMEKYSPHCNQIFLWRSELTQNNNPCIS